MKPNSIMILIPHDPLSIQLLLLNLGCMFAVSNTDEELLGFCLVRSFLSSLVLTDQQLVVLSAASFGQVLITRPTKPSPNLLPLPFICTPSNTTSLGLPSCGRFVRRLHNCHPEALVSIGVVSEIVFSFPPLHNSGSSSRKQQQQQQHNNINNNNNNINNNIKNKRTEDHQQERTPKISLKKCSKILCASPLPLPESTVFLVRVTLTPPVRFQTTTFWQRPTTAPCFQFALPRHTMLFSPADVASPGHSETCTFA